MDVVSKSIEPPSTAPNIEPDVKVGFILAPKFTLVAFASFIDCLRHAADEADRSRQIFCSWKVIAPTLEPIEASCGVEITPQSVFSDPAGFDYVVVVGGLLPWCLKLPPEAYDYLRSVRSKNVSLIGLCTGSFILANAGLLDDHECAVHFEHRQQFAELFPKARPVADQLYLHDRGLVTCVGGIAPLDLAASVIKQHCGEARAVKGLVSLLADRQRTAHFIRNRPYDHLTACGDWRVEQAIEMMERNFSRPFLIEELARRLGSSLRELNRSFLRQAGDSPSVVWRKIRLSHGHWLLLNTNRSATQIAYECGFTDAAHFSRWFKRTYGEAPNAFRLHRKRVSAS
jgi:transcriptional regulator GlxA family with amidase domain